MTAEPRRARVVALSTLGAGSNEEARLLSLLREFDPECFAFDRRRKFGEFRRLVRLIRRERPALVALEGTGLAGGLALLLGRVLFGQKYLVSSGDAVGPWVATRSRLLAPLFGLYERALCRRAAGFVGWTPYLVGRALTFGCPRAATAAGWAPFTRTPEEQAADRVRLRAELGIPPDRLVAGIAGSMVWSARRNYCYGAELVAAARRATRPDLSVLLVGDGTGLAPLKALAAGLPEGRVVFAGRVPQAELPAYYAAMDIASLPQSVDGVGSFRYTTKLSEYLAFRLPVATGQIPLAYDLDAGWLWRLPGAAPWDARYVEALAGVFDAATPEELARKRAAVPATPPEFDQAAQVARVTALVNDILAG